MHSPKKTGAASEEKKKPSTKLDKLQIWVINLNFIASHTNINTPQIHYEEVETDRQRERVMRAHKRVQVKRNVLRLRSPTSQVLVCCVVSFIFQANFDLFLGILNTFKISSI